MNEREWLTSADPEVLVWILWHLARRGTYRPSDRKLSLLACACCRERDPGGPPHGVALDAVAAGRLAVEAAERFADGLGGPEELEHASTAARRAGLRMLVPDDPLLAGDQLPETGREGGTFAHLAGRLSSRLRGDSWSPAEYVIKFDRPGEGEVVPERQARQVGLLRCVIGNPFRPAAVAPAWLAWSDRTIEKLARLAYEERQLPSGRLDPARLAVLADALEEAGCTDPDILSHLREPGVHVRACWVVDQLLGKE